MLPSGIHLNRFVKRCNIFNNILSRGKGFAFLELTDESALRPISYATQRFASSSYNQWVKIEKSYASYWNAFELLHPKRIEEEEYQYMIGGYDSVLDLLAFLDTMQPVTNLMLHLQSLDAPIWKLKAWWPRVKDRMESFSAGLFPRIDVVGNIEPGSDYKGITLLDGWLLEAVEGTGKVQVLKWKMKEIDDVKHDHMQFARDLLASLDARVQSVISGGHIKILEVFDAVSLVALHCGTSGNRMIVDGEYEEYGVEECREVLKALNKYQHIKDSGMDFDPKLSHRYMLSIKDAIYENHCESWFFDDKNEKLVLNGSSIIELVKIESKS